jgi:hypothetical protein
LRIFVTQEFFSGGDSTNSVEDREKGIWGDIPLVRGSAEFANE